MKVIQLYLTLGDPMDYTVHGILQARILEWVAFPFSRGSSQHRDQTQGSNPGLPHCRQILYQLSHKGSPVIAKGCGKGKMGNYYSMDKFYKLESVLKVVIVTQ